MKEEGSTLFMAGQPYIKFTKKLSKEIFFILRYFVIDRIQSETLTVDLKTNLFSSLKAGHRTQYWILAPDTTSNNVFF